MIQIIAAGLISFLVCILTTPLLIRYFSAEGLGQEIREEGPRSHLRKRGTPTMGGLAIIAGITVSYLLVCFARIVGGNGGFTASGLLVLGLSLGTGALGFADDFIKLFKNRNLGLNPTGKLIGQFAVAVAFGLLILAFPNRNSLTPGSTKLSFIRDIDTLNLSFGTTLGVVLFLIFMVVLIMAWSNAVNLTDGLDGLASGSTALVMGAYTVITFWQYLNSCGTAAEPACYQVRDPLDLAVLSAAALGACVGFLWWNAAPAKIFMGDTGSLALGGLVAGISVASRTELLMVIIAALFVMEAASVVIQVAVFKTTGKRFFRMAPFHHHFENGGWAETTVVIRFWILGVIAVSVGLSLFFGEWLGSGGEHLHSFAHALVPLAGLS